ncbi:hypothetical protein DFH06DRAFT_949069, partial [Mycena polygramma]
DASVFVGSPGYEDIRGSLRFFKEAENKTEYPKVGLYQATFTAAKKESGFDVHVSDPEEEAKFLFVGDIKKFCLLQALDTEDPDGSWTIDPCQQVSVHVCCTVTTDDQAAATFTATPEQYTSAFADAKRAAEAEGNRAQPSAFPLIGYIPDSHRFQNVKKPTPFSKRYCGFTGFLTGVSSALECEKMVDRFRIEVDTVAFLG